MNKTLKYSILASALVIAGGLGLVMIFQNKTEDPAADEIHETDGIHEKYESVEDLIHRYNFLAENTVSQESADRNACELYALYSFIRATLMLWHNQPDMKEVASLREHPELLEKMAKEEERLQQNNYYGSKLLSKAYGKDDIAQSLESTVDSNYIYLLLQQKLRKLSCEKPPLDEAVYRIFLLDYEIDLYQKTGYTASEAEIELYDKTLIGICSRLIADPAYRDNDFLISLLRSRPFMPRAEPGMRSKGPTISSRKP